MHVEDIVKNMVKDLFNFEDNYEKYPSAAKALFLKKMLDAFSISLNESAEKENFYNINVINSIISYLHEDTIDEFLKLKHNDTDFNIKGTKLNSLSLLPLSLCGDDGFRIAVDYSSEEFDYLKRITLNQENTFLNELSTNSTEFKIFMQEIKEKFKPFNFFNNDDILNGNVADLSLLMNNLSYTYTLSEKFNITPLKEHAITNKNIVFYYYEILKNDTESYIYNKTKGFLKLYNNLPFVFEYFDNNYNTNSYLVGELLGFDEFVLESSPLNFNEYFITLKTLALYMDKVDLNSDSYDLWKETVSKHWVSAMERINDVTPENFEKLKSIFKIIEKKGFDIDKEKLKEVFSKIENNIISKVLENDKSLVKNIKRL